MRRDSGLPRGTWGESGKAPGRCGSQKRKKGPKALFSSTQAETWIMFGAGNETCTRTVSRCFPITFFVGLASEDLNCSLVFRPRQQIRPKSSTDVQRAALSTPDPRSVHRRRQLPRTGTVAKLAMRQPFVLFKGLTFQKLCLPGAFRPGDHHNKMLRPGLCVVHASPQYL